MRLKLRKHSAGQSEPRRNKSRFPGRSAQKRPTQNIAGKKRVRQEEVDSDYLFANCWQQRAALRENSQRRRGAGPSGILFLNMSFTRYCW